MRVHVWMFIRRRRCLGDSREGRGGARGGTRSGLAGVTQRETGMWRFRDWARPRDASRARAARQPRTCSILPEYAEAVRRETEREPGRAATRDAPDARAAVCIVPFDS